MLVQLLFKIFKPVEVEYSAVAGKACPYLSLRAPTGPYLLYLSLFGRVSPACQPVQHQDPQDHLCLAVQIRLIR
jgi:hypothetical protein